MYALLIYIITSLLVAYYTHRYSWFHIIRLFESLNSSSNQLPPLLHTASSASILQLIASNDVEEKSTRKHVQLVKNIARLAFTATVTCTVVIIEFILVQLNRDMDSTSPEHIFWHLLLLTIVICLIFIQPSVMCYLVVNKVFKSNILDNDSTKIVTSGLVMISWLLFVSKSYIFSDLSVVDGSGFISYYVQRISIIGVTLMAVLNGVGSYSTVYYYLYKRLLRPQSKKMFKEEAHLRVETLEKSLQNTENMISAKELELEQRTESDFATMNKRTNTKPKGSFIDLQLFNQPSEQTALQSEINSLKMIKNEIYAKLLRAKQLVNEQSSSTGTKAHITTLITQIVSVYCVFKILQVSVVHSLQLFRSDDINSSKSDPLVLTLSHITEIFYTVEDEEVLVNQFSFIISGILFICSFNGVFMTLTHIYRFLPIDLAKPDSSSSTSSNNNKHLQKSVSVIKNLFVSELMGIYVIATITILKSNLTERLESKLSTLMLTTGLEMTVVDNWFDKVFLFSVVLAGIVIRMSEVWMDDGFDDQDLMNKIV